VIGVAGCCVSVPGFAFLGAFSELARFFPSEGHGTSLFFVLAVSGSTGTSETNGFVGEDSENG